MLFPHPVQFGPFLLADLPPSLITDESELLLLLTHPDPRSSRLPSFSERCDGMAAIVHAIQATKGKMDVDAALASLKGWKDNSPRGPIMIDPATRDIVMNEYLSEVVKGPDGKLHQKLLATIPNVKDPCKELKVGPCAGRISAKL